MEANTGRFRWNASNGWQTAKAAFVALLTMIIAKIGDDPAAFIQALEGIGDALGWPALATVGMAGFEFFRKNAETNDTESLSVHLKQLKQAKLETEKAELENDELNSKS